MATDAAGNVYLTGDTYGSLGGASLGHLDVWLAKYDPAGRVLWKRQLGTEGGGSWASGVATDAAGNVYLTGATAGEVGGINRAMRADEKARLDVWVAKYDTAGHVQWKRQFGAEGGYAEQDGVDSASGVATDGAGNVYLTGVTGGSLGGAWGGHYDAWLAKYDASGRVLWKRQLGTEDYDSASGVATDAAGNVYLTGVTGGSLGGAWGGSHDAWAAKYNAFGDVLWKRQLGTEVYDSASGVATDAAGNVYLTGVTGGSLGGANRGNTDAWVAKYDASGHALWTRQLGSTDYEYASGVAIDVAENVYLSGSRVAHKAAAWVAKYDAAGHVLWKRELGMESSFDYASGVATNTAGEVYLTGTTDGSLGSANRGGNDAWVAKYSTRR